MQFPKGFKSLDFLGYPQYGVNLKGEIWSAHTRKVRTLAMDRDGYLQVRLNYKRRGKKFFVHRLVALAFIPNPNNLPEVNHIDLDRSNCHVWNLEWMTHADNMRYSEEARAADVL